MTIINALYQAMSMNYASSCIHIFRNDRAGYTLMDFEWNEVRLDIDSLLANDWNVEQRS